MLFALQAIKTLLSIKDNFTGLFCLEVVDYHGCMEVGLAAVVTVKPNQESMPSSEPE